MRSAISSRLIANPLNVCGRTRRSTSICRSTGSKLDTWWMAGRSPTRRRVTTGPLAATGRPVLMFTWLARAPWP